VDHSVNVSILSTYLAMNMGYSHALILQNIAAGALLHDFGKMKVELEEGDSKTVIAEKMKQHPTVGAAFVEAQDKVGGEIKMIIAQHHECFDGTGYPKGLKGGQIYDLARIVAIANVFDELVTEGRGPLPERQARALKLMGGDLAHRFDPQKLDKVLRILKLGL
jgi:putative nucleotidyltransferase with HDIG domain